MPMPHVSACLLSRLLRCFAPSEQAGRALRTGSVSAALGLFLATAVGAADRPSKGVKMTRADGRVRIEVDGQHLTDYVFAGAPHVYFYPLLGPDGVMLTRHAPMKLVEGEDRDHPHHRSLWFAHGAVNGVDFWAETPKAGRIQHEKIIEMKSGRKDGVLKAAHVWLAADGGVTCSDVTTFTVYARADGLRMFDYEVTLKAPVGKALVLGDTKEGTMAIRLAETMRLKPNEHNKGKTTGRIVQSTGVTDSATWGKRAEWCDYSGPVEGRTMGVAIFDHPSNPRHPTWWHVRDYGLFAANPFGVHDFEKKPPGSGDFSVPAGSSVTFRYRFLLHRGDAQAVNLQREFEGFAASKSQPKP